MRDEKTDNDTLRKKWEQRARKVALQVNFSWWLSYISIPLLISSAIGSLFLLTTRREAIEYTWSHAAGIGLILLVSISLIAWLKARKHFETRQQAYLRIEAAQPELLQNRISTAEAQINSYPPIPPKIQHGLRWNLMRICTPLLLSASFLAAGVYLPVSSKSLERSVELPPNQQELQQKLQELRKKDIIQPEYIDEMEKKLNEMAEQPKSEWFNHANLEAADHLLNQHQNQAQNLRRNLIKTAHAIQQRQNNPDLKKQSIQKIQQALQNLQTNAMKPNTALLEQISIAGENSNELSNEQAQQLLESLRENAGALREQTNGNESENDWLEELMNESNESNNCPGGCSGQGCPYCEGDGLGAGGIERGPGAVPESLGRESDLFETGKQKGLSGKDFRNSLPGDLLQLSNGQHQTDQEHVLPYESGSTKNLGDGGSLIWRLSPELTPNEKDAVKHFFDANN